jgi:DNA-binding winged helix-turn-helix (wHTH) protein/TolB-like protein
MIFSDSVTQGNGLVPLSKDTGLNARQAPGSDLHLRVGIWEIDIAARRVRHARGGEVLDMDRSSFDLLLTLARHQGRVLSKDELLTAVWPQRVVSDNSLAKAVSKLRATLQDDTGEQIQVLRGYGYRLAAPVHAVDAASAASTPAPSAVRSRSGWMPRALLLLLASAVISLIVGFGRQRSEPTHISPAPPAPFPVDTRDRLAVLPFRDLSHDGSLAQVAIVLSDQLREDAHRIPQLSMVGSEASKHFTGAPDDADGVRKALGANLVLSGNLFVQGNGFGLHLRMRDLGAKGLDWQRSFAHPLGDLTALQEELALELTQHLGDTPERWRYDPIKGQGTQNREAYLAFLRAASLLGRDEDGQRRAKAALETAVELDPRYADAWIALGSVLGAAGLYADDGEELAQGRQRALAAMDRGIALAPNNAAHYLLRSEMRHLYRHDWEGAEADLIQAEALMPAPSAHFFIQRARMAAARGRLDDAIAFDERATALDPESGSRRNQGWHLIAKGDTAAARVLILQDLANLPNDDHLNFYLALCDIYDGLPEAALRRLQYSSVVFRLTGTAIAQHDRGDAGASTRALNSLIARFPDTAAYQVAEVHAWMGDRDAAFQWLERAIRVGDAGLMYIKFDPLLHNIRGDARYADMLRRLGHPD